MDGLMEHEKRHLDKLRELAPECAVLLKKRGDFPLSEPGKIALYGAGARRTVKGGTGSGDVNSRFYVTVEQGLEEAGFKVTTKDWLRGFDDTFSSAKERFISEVRARARRKHTLAIVEGMGAVMPEPEYSLAIDGEGDTAIYVLSRNSGEGSDRADAPGDYRLTDTEIRDILAANERYEHFMLVLNVGGPVDITPVLDVDNILLLSQLGVVTGWTLADIILGYAVPSGKLATTWARYEDMPKIGDFAAPDITRYREGVYVGYRYFDAAGVRPIFPFGFGLGYTDFAVGESRVSIVGGRINVTVPVFNRGGWPGRETVQVYLSAPWGELDKPVKELAGYGKTRLLSPGEAQRVEVSFELADMASFNERRSAYVLEKGDYILCVGPDSANTVPAAVISLPETLTVRKVVSIGGKTDFEDWRPQPMERPELPDGLAHFEFTRDNLRDLSFPKPADPSTRSMSRAMRLTDDELIYMCCGNFSDNAGLSGVIGSAGTAVAGAAGETCSRTDIPRLVMADGPAGLRLSKYYTRDGDAARPLENRLPAEMEQYMGRAMKFLLNLRRKKGAGPVYDQFCTAIPIGTALAQSFNTELVEKVGVIVGEEMELFGVDLWLAPALNIHRSPLCGRNFEYYSEDPLVSGLTAAAITRGVQSRPGRGVTVKHFCCNNQETNRYISNSMVSKRALREIYIKGFEICIRRADPAAVMTSYNLLNGVHTSEREDLSEGLLRGEWGWGGLIMTDWVVAGAAGKGKYRAARSAPSIAAGNIFMPGSPADYKSARKALEDGVLHSRKARRTAAFVIDSVRRLRGV